MLLHLPVSGSHEDFAGPAAIHLHHVLPARRKRCWQRATLAISFPTCVRTGCRAVHLIQGNGYRIINALGRTMRTYPPLVVSGLAAGTVLH